VTPEELRQELLSLIHGWPATVQAATASRADNWDGASVDLRRIGRTHTSGPIERIPFALTVGRDLGKGGPHSGYRHLADKDEAGGSSPPRPTSGS
jgi:hypothetical protein